MQGEGALSYELPEKLEQAILNGRCIAFVGAGFSACVVPPWNRLLEKIGARLWIPLTIDASTSAFRLEAIGQRLQDVAGPRWEPIVRDVLEEAEAQAPAEQRALLQRRRKLLATIPFKAILTTNFDSSLRGEDTAPGTYWDVLREESRWWTSAPERGARAGRPVPIVKLHGDANGDPQRLPLVLGRADYRRRVYEDPSYASFLRAAFAGYTFLFLGVSFTDAYLNELRSEVLKTIRGADGQGAWGYAVMNRPSDDTIEFFRRYEAVEVLADPTDDYSGFDGWLKAIADATSVQGRLHALLEDERIIWVDPKPENNDRGYHLLSKACRVPVEQLTRYDQLDESRHGDATLVLTNFGYKDGDAFNVLATLNSWTTRPPAIVFADDSPPPEERKENRAACLRRGAFEYTVQWGELYRAIELLLGRTPGELL